MKRSQDNPVRQPGKAVGPQPEDPPTPVPPSPNRCRPTPTEDSREGTGDRPCPEGYPEEQPSDEPVKEPRRGRANPGSTTREG